MVRYRGVGVIMVRVADVLRCVLVRRGVARLAWRKGERRARDPARRKAKGDQYDKSSPYGPVHRTEGNRLLARTVWRENHSATKTFNSPPGALRYARDPHSGRATLHLHLDHESCMEVTVLKGRTRDVQTFADHVIAERGVRHGRVFVVPVELGNEVHAHADAPAHRHSHAHVHRKRQA